MVHRLFFRTNGNRLPSSQVKNTHKLYKIMILNENKAAQTYRFIHLVRVLRASAFENKSSSVHTSGVAESEGGARAVRRTAPNTRQSGGQVFHRIIHVGVSFKVQDAHAKLLYCFVGVATHVKTKSTDKSLYFGLAYGNNWLITRLVNEAGIQPAEKKKP